MRISPVSSPGAVDIDFDWPAQGSVAADIRDRVVRNLFAGSYPDIYDLQGRQVRRLGGSFAAGPQQLAWDGRDAGGGRVGRPRPIRLALDRFLERSRLWAVRSRQCASTHVRIGFQTSASD
jgi:hypothetical protein